MRPGMIKEAMWSGLGEMMARWLCDFRPEKSISGVKLRIRLQSNTMDMKIKTKE